MKEERATKNKYSTVSVPKPLVDKIKKTIKNTGYVSVSDFVTDILRTVLVSRNLDEKGKLDARDEELIKQRLKSLGYLK